MRTMCEVNHFANYANFTGLNQEVGNICKAGSAFEQFEIIRLFPLHLFGNLDLSITNSTLFMGLTLLFFYFLYLTCLKNSRLIPTR